MGAQYKLEQIAESGFREFYDGIRGSIVEVAIGLSFIVPVEKKLVSEEERIQGPVSPEIVKIYRSTQPPISMEMVKKYDSVMENKWQNLLDIIEHRSEYDILAEERARELGVEPKELADLYNLTCVVLHNMDKMNPNRGNPELVPKEEIQVGDSVQVWLSYLVRTNGCFGQKEHKHKEQLKYLWTEEFNEVLTEDEVNYVLHEIGKRMQIIGDKPVKIRIPEIQEATRYEPEQLREKITNYFRELKPQPCDHR